MPLCTIGRSTCRHRQRGFEKFGLQVPMVNHGVVDYLLGRGYRMDSFIAYLLNDKPTGRFENCIMTSPLFLIEDTKDGGRWTRR